MTISGITAEASLPIQDLPWKKGWFWHRPPQGEWVEAHVMSTTAHQRYCVELNDSQYLVKEGEAFEIWSADHFAGWDHKYEELGNNLSKSFEFSLYLPRHLKPRVQDLHQRYCERVGYELPQKLWATRQFRTLIQEAIK